MRKVLIDTSAYSQLLRGSHQVLDVLGRADIVYLSVFVLGELYTGFKGGTKTTANRRLLQRFMARPTVRLCNATEETAQVFAEIKHALKRAGTPIPINDVWIAAHAIQTGAILVTFDSHFARIHGLRLWDQML